MKTPALLALLLGLATAPALLAFEAANLIKNAGFDEVYDNGMPADWSNISHPNHLNKIGTTVAVIPEGQFLRITRKTGDAAQLGDQRVRLDAAVKQVRVGLRIRSTDVKLGDIDWQAPGLSYAWMLADNTERAIGPGSWVLLRYPVDRWTPLETVLTKPADAVGLRVTLQGIGWTGQADFDDITVEPL
jgi:hypothetical protein